MADSKITGLSEDTAPTSTDLIVTVDDVSGTPTNKKVQFANIHKGMTAASETVASVVEIATSTETLTGTDTTRAVVPDTLNDVVTRIPFRGMTMNGKLSVTVASNNITVALKTLAGSDPSAGDPVYVRIGDTTRTVTAALSVTANAGTNWFNAGSSEMATNEADYFVYLGYNATDGVVIGFARVPYGTKYGDFSATSTAQNYCKISTITNAASTDYYEVIGRFAATLSAGAGYTWSVPTFTALNLINRPIYETRWLTWTPTHIGFSVNPSGGATIYQLAQKIMQVSYAPVTAGTSNGTDYVVTAPFSSRNLTDYYQYFATGWAKDNGATVATGSAYMAPNTISITVTKSAIGTWTASGGKIAAFTLFAEIN